MHASRGGSTALGISCPAFFTFGIGVCRHKSQVAGGVVVWEYASRCPKTVHIHISLNYVVLEAHLAGYEQCNEAPDFVPKLGGRRLRTR